MFDVCECDAVKDTGKEEYLRPFIHIGLDWIGYSKADVEGKKSELHTVHWQKLFCYSDAEQNWLAFKEVMEYLQMKYIR